MNQHIAVVGTGRLYTGPQSVRDEVLGDYQAKGFSFSTPDDHVLVLYHEDERIVVFSQVGATISSIREECQKHLERHDDVVSAG